MRRPSFCSGLTPPLVLRADRTVLLGVALSTILHGGGFALMWLDRDATRTVTPPRAAPVEGRAPVRVVWRSLSQHAPPPPQPEPTVRVEPAPAAAAASEVVPQTTSPEATPSEVAETLAAANRASARAALPAAEPAPPPESVAAPEPVVASEPIEEPARRDADHAELATGRPAAPPSPASGLSAASDAEPDAPVDSGRAGATTEPRLRGRLSAVYPRSCRRRGHEGSALLECEVDAAGGVTAVRVLESAGCAALDRAAAAAVRGARFEPARTEERRVASRVQLPIRFRLR